MQDISILKHDYLQTFNCVKKYFGIENKAFEQEIQEHIDKVYTLVLKDAINYCKDNKVFIKNFDDYKVVYFLAIRMHEITKNKAYMLAMLKILDILVKQDSDKFVNEDMIFKIILHIEKDTWQEKYGEYGIYSIFKACSKHLL